MKKKPAMIIYNANGDVVNIKYLTRKKGFSYYLPITLAIVLGLIIIIELTNRELVERVVNTIFFSN